VAFVGSKDPSIGQEEEEEPWVILQHCINSWDYAALMFYGTTGLGCVSNW
jgi:hypothetical protein